MAPRSFHIYNFGCQMNARDSEIMAELLVRQGLSPSVPAEGADITIVNTCLVRDHAEQRALSLLGRLKEWRQARPDRVLVLAGCVTGVRGRDLRQRFPYVDVMVSPSSLLDLPRLIERVGEQNLPQFALETSGHEVPEVPGAHPAGFRAWLKIMEGCDHACTYCVVPQARGRERNRSFDEIVAEAERLSEKGVVEITLLGQTVNAYGKRAGPGRDFAALLRRLSEIPALKRLRFTSSHPAYHTERVLQAFRECEAVCEHMHLPVQSGSDRILKAMRRGHTAASYLNLVERARDLVNDLVVTTDLIVGFPGEEEEDFTATLDLVRSAGLAGAYSFKYSPRPGTLAAGLDGQVPEEVKEDRLARLNALLDEMSRRHSEMLVGTELEVLVEGPRANGDDWQGRLRSNRIVFFPPDGEVAPGNFRRVEITEAATWSVSGRLVAAVRG